MITLPATERNKFAATVNAEARRYSLLPSDYLRKIWYHEEAAKLGEYVAIVLTEQLVRTLSQSGDSAEHLDNSTGPEGNTPLDSHLAPV